MADKHPYMSGAAGLNQVIEQLRRAFPPKVTAETLKKLGISPNNETYVLNTLRFIGVLDSEGRKNPLATSVFNKHDDDEFQAGFSELIQKAYQDLFTLYGDTTWTLPAKKLISYFRNTDHTSAIVGQRQASTFQALAALGGKCERAARVVSSNATRSEIAGLKTSKSKPAKAAVSKTRPVEIEPLLSVPPARHESGPSGMALTVRVEINLPSGGDKDTYDLIFRSIRENLLNGNDI